MNISTKTAVPNGIPLPMPTAISWLISAGLLREKSLEEHVTEAESEDDIDVVGEVVAEMELEDDIGVVVEIVTKGESEDDIDVVVEVVTERAMAASW